MLYCDTRQQKDKHGNIDLWLDAHKVEYEYRKLDFGDYSTPSSNISVDTKQGMVEVAGNVGRDHARFARECDRAAAEGWRLVVLVEEHPEFERDRSLMDGWVAYPCRRCRRCDPLSSTGCRRYRSKPMQGATIRRIIEGLERNHGCRFMFCNRRKTARIICELLGVPYES